MRQLEARRRFLGALGLGTAWAVAAPLARAAWPSAFAHPADGLPAFIKVQDAPGAVAQDVVVTPGNPLILQGPISASFGTVTLQSGGAIIIRGAVQLDIQTLTKLS